EKSGVPPLESLSPAQARAQYAQGAAIVAGHPPEIFATRDLEAPGPFGAIPLRLYTPRDPRGDRLPVLVYLHGGGYVIGSRDSHDVACRYLALGGDCLVASVDYHLAPEHPFPEPVDDCWAALEWIAAHAPQLGGRSDALAIGGDSAGGNLAAALCLLARDRGGPGIAFQLLIYPGIDMTLGFPSQQLFANGYRLTHSLIEWFYDQYFSGADRNRRDPRCSVLLAEDLSRLPPTLIIGAGYDPLRDEGLAYHKRLVESGVRTRHSLYPGMIHGFINMTAFLDASRACLDECGRELRACFAARSTQSGD
ncbi:MAG TPA: alpha/beta hydrolase, partial [Nevskiaceae bacterium]